MKNITLLLLLFCCGSIDNTLYAYSPMTDLGISASCVCGNPSNIMIDPADDPNDPMLMVAYFADEITILAPPGATITTFISDGLLDATGTTLNLSLFNFINNGDTDGDGLEEWVANVWHATDMGYTLSINIDGTTLDIANSCTQCVQSIPTIGEWGLITLGLMMSIVSIIGIRQRKAVEMYS